MGFDKVKALRTQFAVEAARVFAEYAEILSDTLFTLEEEGNRETAMAAIERIKPLRVALRTESRLLAHHRHEIGLLLKNVSSAIDEIFEESKKAYTEVVNRIKMDVERLEKSIQCASDFSTASALINSHRELCAKIRESDVSIAGRRELRFEMERIWRTLDDALNVLRSSNPKVGRIDDVISRLERQGFLVYVKAGEKGVPNIWRRIFFR